MEEMSIIEEIREIEEMMPPFPEEPSLYANELATEDIIDENSEPAEE